MIVAIAFVVTLLTVVVVGIVGAESRLGRFMIGLCLFCLIFLPELVREEG